MNKILFLFLFLALRIPGSAQVFPGEGSVLHYRLVGFSFPVAHQANSYKIEVAEGNHNSQDSFRKKIVVTAETKSNKMIVEVPAFGRSYTWHIVYNDKKKTESPFYHFSTKMNNRLDTAQLRLRVLQPAVGAHKDDYIAVDWGGVLYDMNGRAVWCIPDTNGLGGNVADLKFTPQGTITFLFRSAYEINYNGDVLWKSPKNGLIIGDTLHGELYHHEFLKLSNGHYMALCMQLILSKTVTLKDSSYIVLSDEDSRIEKPGYRQGKYGCLVEYDQHGNIVWTWKSVKYLQEADLAYYNPVDSNQRYDAHDNAFFFDQKNNCIYVGFKNINRIVKIDYPSGKVLREYGASLKPGVITGEEGLFCNQHSIGKTSEGYLYYFNNNSCVEGVRPSVNMLQEPVSASGKLKKVWEYSCVAEGKFNSHFANGGNAIELPDRALFVNMGSKYSKLSIIDRDKKTLWSAMPERYVESEEKWIPAYEYRANIISRKDLEKLIWNAEIPVSSE